MNSLIENYNSTQHEKIQKPNFNTKIGREFLAFYLQTKFKQIINWDKKSEKQIFIEIKEDFIQRFLQRLISKPQEKIIIGITGETASGKSTICNKIAESIQHFNMPITILNADNYFKDISDLVSKYGNFDALLESGYDVDSPDNFQLNLLAQNIKELKDGSDILAPKYLVNGTGICAPLSIPIKCSKIIVVEGMATMFDPVQEFFDIKVYVEIDDKIRKKRYLERAKVRNQDKENALRQWNYVLGTGNRYIKPSKENCDMVINGECDLQYFAQMIEYMNMITNSFQEG